MIGVGRGNKIEVIDSIDFPHSAGIFYTALTQLLGFPHYGDEYKVMGLAPYGKPQYVDKLKDVLQFTDDGLFRLNMKYFNFAADVVERWAQQRPDDLALWWVSVAGAAPGERKISWRGKLLPT